MDPMHAEPAFTLHDLRVALHYALMAAFRPPRAPETGGRWIGPVSVRLDCRLTKAASAAKRKFDSFHFVSPAARPQSGEVVSFRWSIDAPDRIDTIRITGASELFERTTGAG